MFSLHAFNSTLASTTAGYQNVVPAADPIATVSGNLLYVGGLPNLLGAFMLSTESTVGKIETPSLLNLAPYQISPIVKNALPTATRREMINPASPRPLVTNEAMQVYGDATSGQPDPDVTVGVVMSDGALSPVAGDIFHAYATIVTGSIKDAWNNVALTFQNTLPAGTYDVVGARVEGAHGKLFRLVFQGNSSIRPGSLFAYGTDGEDVKGARDGGWGVWGTFDQFTPPSIDVFTDGTSETAQVFLDLIKKA